MRTLLLVALVSGCGAPVRQGVGGGGGDLAHLTDGGVADLSQVGPDQAMVYNVCLGGHYGGTYDGTVEIAGLIPASTSGTVDLTLGMQNGEFFDITNGTLMGMASGNPYSADLIGTLDCGQLKLVNGMLMNGKVTISGIDYLFTGPMTADYDPMAVAFVNGTWNIKQTSGPSTGMGTWTAKQ